MRWDTFLERREARRLRALGDWSVREALAAFRLVEDEDALAAVVRALEGADLRPGPALLAASLAPPDALPPPPPSRWDVDEPLHRLRLVRALEARLPAEALVPASPRSRRAWALETLCFLGEQVEDRERAAWSREPLAPSPAEDAEAAQLWARMFQGGAAVWSDQRRWEKRCVEPAMAAFRQVLSTRELPPGVAKQALAELRDGLWYQLLGGKGGVPGWAELAARVVETSGGVPALALALADEDWSLAARCTAARGTWPATVGALLPEVPGGPARALVLGRRLQDTPDRAESILDAHVVLRLLSTWEDAEGADPLRSWGVVVQNRGKARGRLRALAMGRPAALKSALLSLDALHARTVLATRRYAWDWAWESMARGFAWDFANAVTPPCEAPDDALDPLGPELVPAVRTWVLLVLLKGRHDHLQRWVQTGGTGDRDGTWGRLLSDELPEILRDPLPPAPARGRVTATYHRLRAWLADGLDETIAGLRPTLVAVAALPPGRQLARAAEALLAPTWDARVPFPKAGFPTFQEHASQVVAGSQPAL